MNNSVGTVETGHSFSLLLEYAADNDVEGFKKSICDESEIREMRLWYGHHRVSKKGALEHRTPLMVAAKYGSVDVVKLILSLPEVDVNFTCGPDKSTALHCAACGGSFNAIDVVKLLLLAGADPNSSDANGHRPVDIIFAHPKFPNLKLALEKLLRNVDSSCQWDLQISTNSLSSISPPMSSSSEEGSVSPVSCSYSKKEYTVDPSVPVIMDSAYTTDEFRMFSFKIRPCSRAYFHDWTECPFAHPGENARRRDPRRFHYSCVPCPDHRKGECSHGDFCEYSHGIFESWLHPAQYRTRLCKDGTSCTRRVCFFAHTTKQLRPLYASTGAAAPSLQASAMDFTAALNLLPGSPSAVSVMSPFSFTPSISASGNDLYFLMDSSQQNIPNLKISGNNLQTSCLRTSFNARDIPTEELSRFRDSELLQQQLLDDLFCVSQSHHNSSTNISAYLKQFNPTNPDKIMASDISSPQNIVQPSAASGFSPSYKSAVLNKLQQPSIPSPIETGFISPTNVSYPFLNASFDSSSPRIMSPQINYPISPSISQLPVLAHREKLQAQLGSLISKKLDLLAYDHGFNGVNSWSEQHPASLNVDWSVKADEVFQLQKLHLNGHYVEEPDVSWVQSVLKESPFETEETTNISASSSEEGSNSNPHSESSNHVALQALLEGLQLDQIIAS